MILTIAVGAIILIIVFGTILHKSNILTLDFGFLESTVSFFRTEEKEFLENRVEKISVEESEINTNLKLNSTQNQTEEVGEKLNITNDIYYQIREMVLIYLVFSHGSLVTFIGYETKGSL